jgi:hypothetical protein
VVPSVDNMDGVFALGKPVSCGKQVSPKHSPIKSMAFQEAEIGLGPGTPKAPGLIGGGEGRGQRQQRGGEVHAPAHAVVARVSLSVHRVLARRPIELAAVDHLQAGTLVRAVFLCPMVHPPYNNNTEYDTKTEGNCSFDSTPLPGTVDRDSLASRGLQRAAVGAGALTRPPMLVPCPPSHLVSECVTTSAPCASGWVRYGVEKVESTTSGTPFACASAEMASTARAGNHRVS